jgi:hypothetical protein
VFSDPHPNQLGTPEAKPQYVVVMVSRNRRIVCLNEIRL